jgi:hypothetical protein
MIKELIKMANKLDEMGHRDLASRLDSILTQNKAELNKLAGEVPAWEAMSHEEHSAIEESPGFTEFEAEEDLKRWESAEQVAKLIVGGTPVFGQDPETGERAEETMTKELTEILDKTEHSATIMAILDFIDPQ